MSSETPPTTSKSRFSRNVTLAILAVVLVATTASLVFVFDRLVNRSRQTGIDTGAAIIESGEVFDGGTAIDPPRQLADFTLISHSGDPISLSDLRGKVVLLYFGYTNCPDFCPTTLGDYKQIKEALGADAEKVAFVMISVDGSRDTPEALNAYLSAFDPDFIGMTGDENDVEHIGAEYGLYFERRAGDTAEEYLVDHATSIYAIDPEGRLTMVYMYGTEPDVIAEDIRAALS